MKAFDFILLILLTLLFTNCGSKCKKEIDIEITTIREFVALSTDGTVDNIFVRPDYSLILGMNTNEESGDTEDCSPERILVNPFVFSELRLEFSSSLVINNQDTIPALTNLMDIEIIKNTLPVNPHQFSSLSIQFTSAFFDLVDFIVPDYLNGSTGVIISVPLSDGQQIYYDGRAFNFEE